MKIGKESYEVIIGKSGNVDVLNDYVIAKSVQITVDVTTEIPSNSKTANYDLIFSQLHGNNMLGGATFKIQ